MQTGPVFRSSRAAAAVVTLCCITLAGCDRHKDAIATTAPAADVKTVVTPTGVEMALIPAGTFIMGDDHGDDDQRPAHRVTLSAFYMDCREVTQSSFQALTGNNPARFKDPNKPVESASWRAAIKYCNLRSAREGLKPCYALDSGACDFSAGGYRLPTEAEWEYACRAGSDSAAPAGALAEQAWFKANAAQTTHAVGQKRPNAWGLYDMLGNVSEWCNDRYSENAYAAPATTDPCGPDAGDERVLRGGNWRSGEDHCRPAARAGEAPGLADVCFGYDGYGFRCVKRAGQTASPPH